ncbi:hypothetical protein OIU84_009501 [Salix udensis]|uniref:Cytochrome P450 n=1 Tax=Salix udensis TaxID=889485 RepID=A0AAD6JRJ5_9ROSI|nr:hypothetical protein OIU84_009501 [Salix udensis]
MASLELGSVSIRMHAFDLIMSEIRSRLLPLLSSVADKQEVLDLQDVFRRFSFDNICKFSFGLDPGCLELSLPACKIAAAFDTASKLSAARALAPSPIVWKIKRLLSIGSEKELKQAIKKVNELAEGMINQRRKAGFSNKNNDLLSRFMTYITDEKYLRDIVISFLLAGRDTVASGLTSFFWLLSQRPEVESAIRAETEKVMGSNQDLPSFQEMREMHCLNAAVHESLRLYPPVQFDSKFSQDDDKLPDGTFGKEMALVEMKAVALAIIRGFNTRVVDPKSSTKVLPGSYSHRERWLAGGDSRKGSLKTHQLSNNVVP